MLGYATIYLRKVVSGNKIRFEYIQSAENYVELDSEALPKTSFRTSFEYHRDATMYTK